MRNVRFAAVGPLVAVAFMLVASAAEAITASIDTFTVQKNGALLFQDPFSDGNPPPSAPNFATGTPASYFTTGTPTESGGRAHLDAIGAASSSFAGTQFLGEEARLLTNIDPANLALGLKNDDTFSVSGVFDLVVPGPIREQYGVRLTDVAPGNQASPDTLVMRVVRGLNGSAFVSFARLDFGAQINTNIDNTLLEPGHDQIRLTLARTDATLDAITASFAYIDGGVEGPTTTFAGTADIFNTVNFTRAEFDFFTPAPVGEPSTLLMLGGGLIGLGSFAYRGHRKH